MNFFSRNTGTTTQQALFERLKETIDEISSPQMQITEKKLDDDFNKWFQILGTGLKEEKSWTQLSSTYHEEIVMNLNQIIEIRKKLKTELNKNSEFLRDNIIGKIKTLETKGEELQRLNDDKVLARYYSQEDRSEVVDKLPRIGQIFGGKRKSKRKTKSSRRRRRNTKRR